MNKPPTPEQLIDYLDQTRPGGADNLAEPLSPEFQADLNFARSLSQINFSQGSPLKDSLRARLMVRARQKLPAQRGAGFQLRQTRRILKTAGLVILVLILAAGLDWVLRTARPQPAGILPGGGSPTALSAQPATPAVALPPSQTASPRASTSFPPRLIGPASTHAQLRESILQPVWDTLWLEGEIHSTASGGTAQVTYVQVWLARDGRGRVMTSQPLPAATGFNLDIAPATVSISSGSGVTTYQFATRDYTQLTAGTLHPLENANRLTQMLFPSYLAIRNADVAPLREETAAGRPALVLDWGGDRLWVDEATGLILRQEHSPAAGNAALSGDQVLVRQLVLGTGLPDAVIRPPFIDELRFETAPALETVPVAGVTPSVEAASSPSPSPDGQIVLQASGQPPFQWQMLVFPTDCLTALTRCPDPAILAGAPNFEATELNWSPDRSLAVLSDTNVNKLIVFDRASGQWQRIVDGFYQSHLAWSLDGQAIAAVGAGSDDYNDGLVIIRRDGWKVQAIDTPLKGNKSIAGWIDAQTLAVTISISPFKGQTPAWAAENPQPGLYRVDIFTGKATLIISGNGLGWASVSPDGSQLAYSHIEDSQLKLVVSNADGSGALVVNSNSQLQVWSPKGDWIASIRLANSGDTLILLHPDGTGVQSVPLDARLNGAVIWKPDGKALLVETGNPSTPGVPFGLSELTLVDGVLHKVDLPYLKEVTNWLLLGWQP